MTSEHVSSNFGILCFNVAHMASDNFGIGRPTGAIMYQMGARRAPDGCHNVPHGRPAGAIMLQMGARRAPDENHENHFVVSEVLEAYKLVEDEERIFNKFV